MKAKMSEKKAEIAHFAALKRLVVSGDKQGSEPHYNSRLNIHEQIGEIAESIAAEWIVSDYFELDYDPFEPKGKYKADVGRDIEVKWTLHSGGNLIIYPSDRITGVAVLVTGKHPNYKLEGWIPVAHAKRPRYKKSSQDSWWISANNLHPIETLRSSNYADNCL